MASKEDRKREIIHAASRIFSQHGYHHAKIEDIAKEAGIGKGTVYEYFSSKKTLFQEMILYSIEEYIEMVRRDMLQGKNTKDKLKGLGRCHGEFLDEHIDLAHMVANQSDMIPKDMKCHLIESRRKIFEIIGEIIEEGIKQGELRSDLNKEIAIFSIIGTINQYYTKKIFIDQANHEDINVEAIVDTLFKGIGA